MRRFVSLHGANSRIVLISGDGDFTDDIFDIKTRKNVEILVIYPHKASDALKLFAHELLSYNDLVADVHADVETCLKVTNLHSSVEDRALNQDSKALLSSRVGDMNGKISLYESEEGTAILSFTNSGDAKRFRELYSNHLIGNRKIFVQNYQNKGGKSRDRQPRIQSLNRFGRTRRCSSNDNSAKMNPNTYYTALHQTNGQLQDQGKDEYRLRQEPVVRGQESAVTGRESAVSTSVSSTDSVLVAEEEETTSTVLSSNLKDRIARRINRRRRVKSESTEAQLKFQASTMEETVVYQVTMEYSREAELKLYEQIYRTVGRFHSETVMLQGGSAVFKFKLQSYEEAIRIKECLDGLSGCIGSTKCIHECSKFSDEKVVRILSILNSVKANGRESKKTISDIYMNKYNESISGLEIRNLILKFQTQEPRPSHFPVEILADRAALGDILTEQRMEGKVNIKETLAKCDKLRLTETKQKFIELCKDVVENKEDRFQLLSDKKDESLIFLVWNEGRMIQRGIFLAHHLYLYLMKELNSQDIPHEKFMEHYDSFFPDDYFDVSRPTSSSLLFLDGDCVSANPSFTSLFSYLRDISKLEEVLKQTPSLSKKVEEMPHFLYLYNNNTNVGMFDKLFDENVFNDIFDLKYDLKQKTVWKTEDWIFLNHAHSSTTDVRHVPDTVPRKSYTPVRSRSRTAKPQSVISPSHSVPPNLASPSLWVYSQHSSSVPRQAKVEPKLPSPKTKSSTPVSSPQPRFISSFVPLQPPDLIGGLVARNIPSPEDEVKTDVNQGILDVSSPIQRFIHGTGTGTRGARSVRQEQIFAQAQGIHYTYSYS